MRRDLGTEIHNSPNVAAQLEREREIVVKKMYGTKPQLPGALNVSVGNS